MMFGVLENYVYFYFNPAFGLQLSLINLSWVVRVCVMGPCRDKVWWYISSFTTVHESVRQRQADEIAIMAICIVSRAKSCSAAGIIQYLARRMWDIPHGHFPLGQFPSHLRHPPAVKVKIWKLALTHTLDPNRPTTRGPDPYPNPNRPTGQRIIWKLALTRIPDPNRPTTWDSDPNHSPNPNRPTGELSENWH